MPASTRWSLSRSTSTPVEMPMVWPVSSSAKTLPVVAVCRNGQASEGAAKRLKQAGFEHVYWLDGGIAAWQQAELPLVKGR